MCSWPSAGATSAGVSLDSAPGLVFRRDLIAVPTGTGDAWNVKDPLTLRYYRFGEQEWLIAQLLDGRTSLREIAQRFQRRFAPVQLGKQQLAGFLDMLVREGLVQRDPAAVENEADEMLFGAAGLLERRRQKQAVAAVDRITNLLAIRFRGIDPDALLTRWHARLRPVLRSGTAVLMVLAFTAAVVLIALRPERLWSEFSPAMFLEAEQWVWLLVAVAVAKTLHELGHALACKHFGGECHEMGVMLLAFTPCLYCNVSDSWMLPGKWQRIAVSAAGVGVELVLFSVCTFLWWFSTPGGFQSLCFQLMLVCSVSTLLLNANPLLRYDAYFVLSDLVEVPNLRQQADAVLRGRLRGWFLGERPDEALSGLPRWLGAYALASLAYRWFVVCAIFWLLHRVLAPQRLQSLLLIPAVLTFGGMLLPPVRRLMGVLRTWPRMPAGQRRRLVSRSVLAAACGGLLFVPWPYRVTVDARVHPQDRRAVYVTVGGRLSAAPKPGTQVEAGDVLCRLTSSAVEREIAALRGQCNRQKLRVAALGVQSLQGISGSKEEVAAAQERLADLEQRLRERLRDRERLTLTAPVAGMVYRSEVQSGGASREGLPRWEGAATDAENAGCVLETGQVLCEIGHPVQREAILAIDEADVDLVRVGQRVELQFARGQHKRLTGRVGVVEEAGEEPGRYAGGRGLATAAGRQRVLYRARVPIEGLAEQVARLPAGLPGRARIEVAPQSPAVRAWRWVSRTFGVSRPFAPDV